MFVGIDGTGSYDEAAYWSMNHNSFVGKTISRTSEKYKRYFRGPYAFGLGCERIAQDAVKFIRAVHLGSKSDEPIFLVGHSRGGAVCVRVAEILNTPELPPLSSSYVWTIPSTSFTEKEDPLTKALRDTDARDRKRRTPLMVDAMFLFDAVDMSTTVNAACISGNVKRAYHAIRDPTILSRPGWGNCALQIKPPGRLFKKIFSCTHAGCGGTPWTGDHPATNVGGEEVQVFQPTITEYQDKAVSQDVWTWMYSWMYWLGAL